MKAAEAYISLDNLGPESLDHEFEALAMDDKGKLIVYEVMAVSEHPFYNWPERRQQGVKVYLMLREKRIPEAPPTPSDGTKPEGP